MVLWTRIAPQPLAVGGGLPAEPYRVRYELACLLADREELADAERHLVAALEAVPTYAEATLELAQLRRRSGRARESMALLIELLQRDPYNMDALLRLGEVLLEAGRREDALLAFGRVLRFDPDHAGALYHEGVLLAEQHRYRDAIDRWNRVVEVDGDGEFARRARRDARTAADLQHIFASRGEG